MADSNAIYIYIRNNTPVILNVDNETDGAALEQLGTLKMPESMVTEIFGENVQYADNTNCTVTANPDNQEFPFTVAFDASKILAKPKRELGTMAGVCMPSDKYIDLVPNRTNSAISRDGYFTAPENGYLTVSGYCGSNITPIKTANVGEFDIALDSLINIKQGTTYVGTHATVLIGCVIPVVKGKVYLFGSQGLSNIIERFYYAQGTI